MSATTAMRLVGVYATMAEAERAAGRFYFLDRYFVEVTGSASSWLLHVRDEGVADPLAGLDGDGVDLEHDRDA
jgi:hypothetical protein